MKFSRFLMSWLEHGPVKIKSTAKISTYTVYNCMRQALASSTLAIRTSGYLQYTIYD